jgi:hypothetical protein
MQLSQREGHLNVIEEKSNEQSRLCSLITWHAHASGT